MKTNAPTRLLIALPAGSRRSARSICAALGLVLGVLPLAMKADPTLEARGYADAITAGTFDDLVLHNATSADSVTRTVSMTDSNNGMSGTTQVSGTATFGALSGSGSTSSTGRTADSYFQAQPLAIARDYITIFGSGPVDLTLHYVFDANVMVPNNQPGTVVGLVEGQVFLNPWMFTNNSQIITNDKFFIAGNTTVPPGAIVPSDASLGASTSVSGSTTVRVDPGATYSLYGALLLFGQAQNLNFDGHQIDVAVAGSLSYWVSFDSPDAYLTSESGATYEAPGGGSACVPEGSTAFALLGLGLGTVGLARRWRREDVVLR